MTTVSPAMLRQLQAVDDPDGLLLLVLIDNPSLSGPARVVADTRDWDIGGETYVGIPLSITLPQDVSKEAARAVIEIDNVGRELLAELEALPPGTSLDCTLRIVSRANPSVIEWDFTTGATTANVTLGTISLVLGDDEFLRRGAVNLRYEPDTAPAIFAG